MENSENFPNMIYLKHRTQKNFKKAFKKENVPLYAWAKNMLS